MQWWHALVDSFGSILGFIALVLVLLVRAPSLAQPRGRHVRVQCADHAAGPGPPDEVVAGWMIGLGRYAGDNLEWFRTFSFYPRPRYVFGRSMQVLAAAYPPWGRGLLALRRARHHSGGARGRTAGSSWR